jgi:hypothetical protein
LSQKSRRGIHFNRYANLIIIIKKHGKSDNMIPSKVHNSLAVDPKYIEVDEMLEKESKRMVFKKSI